jgi:hypothetical protein
MASPRTTDYVLISVNERLYRAHRLAWLYTTGQWPAHVIDHIDGDAGNNRLANLREVTTAENIRNQRRRGNNTSGYKGVSFAPGRRKCWHAQIMLDGRQHHLGFYADVADAHAAYCEAAARLHGAFARTA